MKGTKGTYVSATFTGFSNYGIEHLIEKLKVPNPVDKDDFHTTITYSRKDLKLKEETKELDVVALASGLDIWDDNGKKILVLLLKSPGLEQRNTYYKNLGATSDYDTYRPHITLSTDIENWKLPGEIFGVFSIITEFEKIEELNFDA